MGELAHNYMIREEYSKALEFAKEKEHFCRLTGNNISLANSYQLQGAILMETENYLEALKFLKLAEEKNIEIGSPTSIAVSKLNLGSSFLKMKTYDQSLPLLMDSLEIFRKLEEPIFLGHVLQRLGELLNCIGKHKEALDYNNEALTFFIKKSRIKELVECAKQQISILGNLERFEDAYNVIENIEGQFKEIDQHKLFANNSKLALTGDFLKKLKEQKKNESSARVSDDKMLLQHSIGEQLYVIILNELNWKKEEAKLLKEREELCTELHFDAGLAEISYLKGKILNNEGDYKESLNYLERAIAMAKEAGHYDIMVFSSYETGLVLKKVGDIKNAIGYLKAAITGLKKMESETILKQAMKQLKELESEEIQTSRNIQNSDSTINSSDGSAKTESSKNTVIEKQINDYFEQVLKTYSSFVCLDNLGNFDISGKKKILQTVSFFISEGKTKASSDSLKSLNEYFISSNRFQDFSQVLAIIGIILSGKGCMEEAIQIFEKQEYLCKSTNNSSGVAEACHYEALIYSSLNNLKEATRLLQKEEKILSDIQDPKRLQMNLQEQSEIYKKSGTLQLALEICKKREALCLKYNIKNGLANSFNKHSIIFSEMGRNEEALELLQKSEKLYRELNDKEGLQFTLGNQAMNFLGRKKYSYAIDLCKQKETICEELGNKKELAVAYGFQGIIYGEMEQLDQAFDFLIKEEKICREIGAEDRLQVSIGNKANVLIKWNRFEESLPLLKEKENICRKLNNSYGLAIALMNQASILSELGMDKDSRSCAEEASNLIEKCGYNDLKQTFKKIIINIEEKKKTSLNEKISQSHKNQKTDNTGADLRQGQVNRNNENHPAGQTFQKSDYEEALQLLVQREMEIRRKVNNQKEYQSNISEQAYTLAKLGRYQEAMKKYKFSEELCARNQMYEAYTDCLLSQAEILIDHMDNPKQAKALLEEAILVARENNFPHIVDEAKKMLEKLA